MFGWLTRSGLPSRAEIEWLFDTWTWLSRHLGVISNSARAPLVTPSDEFFPIAATRGAALAEALFERTRALAGMEAWPCVLEPRESRSMNLRTPVLTRSIDLNDPAGTFYFDRDRGVGVVTYDEASLERDLEDLIATFAHELSHYLMKIIDQPPPSPGNIEQATDVCVSFLGFGLFSANAAFRFSQFQDETVQGWSTGGLGYLSEQMHAYSLAIFTQINASDPRVARKYLRPNPKSYYAAALRDLGQSGSARLELLREGASAHSSDQRRVFHFDRADDL